MKLFVEAWDPSYGAAVESSEFANGASSEAELDCDVEVPAGAWVPMSAPPDVGVFCADGVIRPATASTAIR